MKKQQQLLFSLSVSSLVLILLICSRPGLAQQPSQSNQPVVDENGDHIQVGNKYYVISAIWGAGGGGLTLSNYRTGGDCPLTVTQEISDLRSGIPCSFHPASSSSDKVIRTSEPLNVKFDAQSGGSSLACANSTVWQVGHLDPYTRSRLVTIQGVEGNPGCETVNSWFEIEQTSSEGIYKLAFNPSEVCSEAEQEQEGITATAGDLAIGFSPQGRPLIVSSSGSSRVFSVVFKKFEEGQGQDVGGKAYVK